MDRVNGEDFINIGGGKRGFRDEDLLVGIAGTEITAAFLNGIQEEILAVIEDAGLVPSEADRAQLLKALRRKWAGPQPFIPLISATTDDPPDDPEGGAAYLVPPTATGEWAGHGNEIAIWTGNIWLIRDVPVTTLVGVSDTNRYFRRTATGWAPVALSDTPPPSRARLLFFGSL